MGSGCWKAGGFTPRQVGAVFALESTALGLVAAALGFAFGSTLVPRLAAPSAERSSVDRQSRRIRGTSWSPAWSSPRTLLRGADVHSSQHSLQRARGDPRRRLVSAEFTAFARVDAILSAVDDTARPGGPARQRTQGAAPGRCDRPRRCSGGLALSLDATLDAQAADDVTTDIPDELPSSSTPRHGAAADHRHDARRPRLLSVRKGIRDYGVLKAIGLRPRQITSTVVSAHAALALVASLLAVPLGVGLYLGLAWITSGTTEDAVVASWPSLALIPIGTVLVVVAATTVPARLATRIRTSDALRYE